METKIMHEALTVLVLGVGGNVSQGILKALGLCKIPCRVIGACISPLAFGLYLVDQAHVSPLAVDPNFLDWLMNICATEDVDAILSGSEPVLRVLAESAGRIKQETGAVCIVSDPQQLRVGDDKLETCKWLKSQELHFPQYASAEDKNALLELVQRCGYPLIAKPRGGKGRQGVFEIHTPVDLEYIMHLNDYVVEEYVGSPNSEYTVGCFCDRDAKVRGTMVMHRELLEGTTYRAEVGVYPEVRAQAIKIATALKPLGPCNIQLRLHHGKPVCFEINVRFSGTTPLRARLGFNEVELALRHFVLGEPALDLPLIRQGIILRYWNEIYVDSEAYHTLKEKNRLDNPAQFNSLLEDYGMKI
jgi:carbamoyl-phosphate synthase large subunit